ncbi:hypothetical protein EOW66_19205 [Sinirhodobacter huangdaonensis]|uniref:Uncharacterized protein n=1 Tax=Paenirhodobacter huangdaonensis TaxID=2501515 RepID=A0A3S3PCI4_9RHOB|nr:hypothetical protein EOW66_19205 [Sinirhodobacter huangdaonensis]
MPSATATGNGLQIWTTPHLREHTRNSLHFQITPRLSGVFQDPQGDPIYEQLVLADRSADGGPSPLLSQERWPPMRG